MDNLSLLSLIGLALLSIFAGANAAVVGFGIGSLLTPVYALAVGTDVAVGVVAIPHFLATGFRYLLLKKHVHKGVLLSFGIPSALGGLLGAWLHTRFDNPILSKVLGSLLILAGLSEVTGLLKRLTFGKKTAISAGLLSGAFGGLVGNQGGIRSAALLTFNIPKEQFIATATVIALMVDGARLPVYLVSKWSEITGDLKMVLLFIAGTIIGTLIGKKSLDKIPKDKYRKIVGGLVFVLGILLIFK